MRILFELHKKIIYVYFFIKYGGFFMENEKKVAFSQEKMCSIGKRVKECRKNAGMTQEQVVDAILSLPGNRDKSRNPKQLSAIENGRRELSPEYAHLLAKVFRVRYEYLMCEDDYKTEGIMYQKSNDSWDKRRSILRELLSLAGYELICDFITNTKELGIDKNIYGPFSESHTIARILPDELMDIANLNTEIRTPNNKIFYCDFMDLQLLEDELIDYIHFRMKYFESKYAWLFDDAKIKKRIPGSETTFYKPLNNLDPFENAIWIDHNDDDFPSMNNIPAYAPSYKDK